MSKKGRKISLDLLDNNEVLQKPAENIRMTTVNVAQSSETC